MAYKNNKSKYFSFLLLLPVYIHATNEFVPTKYTEKVLMFDQHGSPHATSFWLSSSRVFINEIEDKWFDIKAKDKFWLRWSSLVINNLCNDLLMLFAHEVSGHGFRQRSFDVHVDGYSLMPLFGGITSFVTPINGLGVLLTIIALILLQKTDRYIRILNY